MPQTLTVVAAPNGTANSNSNDYLIGLDGGSLAFDGKIDDVRLYNYIRSAEEVRVDYNAGLSTHFR